MHLKSLTRQSYSRTIQRGIGLVELMVGITVGLIVSAGAAIIATRQINEHRRLMLEVQIQQDLRVAADLLQQDLRRAGYRGLPANGVWEPAHDAGTAPAKAASASPYTELSTTRYKELFYRYAGYSVVKGKRVLNESNVLAPNEQFGIRLKDKTLSLLVGEVWQPITDPEAVLIEDFIPVIDSQVISLDDICACPAGSVCPTQTVRRVEFTIKAVAKSDANVKRTLTVSERIRADDISGVCP